jgi:hypothetical protein
MPTAGWILEDARDRFLYGTTTVPDPGPPPPPRFACPFCYDSFSTKGELRRHSIDQHVAGRPFLMAAEREPASTETIRTPLHLSDTDFLNTTSAHISFDGIHFQEHPTEVIAKHLSGCRISRVWVRLENNIIAKAQPIRTDYDLEFRIYNSNELLEVDELFVAHLGRAEPTVGDVDQFLQKSRSIGASEYADALGDYVLGVLVKDGDPIAGVRSGERDYRRKYNRALRTLQSFDRPLAKFVCALIRFSSNDFNDIHETGFGLLDATNVWLANLTGMQSGPPLKTSTNFSYPESRMEICPIDNGSDAVVSEAAYLSSRARWSEDVDSRVRAVVGLAALDPLDRVKLLALWADTAIRLQQPDGALDALRSLVGNDCFGRWAASRLEEYER